MDTLEITASRGCVNRCLYCDDCFYSPFFVSRKGQDVATEMIFLKKKYSKINHFNFTDSLINGNIEELRTMSKFLIDYKKNKELNFTWGGRFACRSKDCIKINDYEIFKKAGMNNISIGIESPVEGVRKKMNKLFIDRDLNFMIKQCEKNKIIMIWGMMIGYPGETEEDFEDTLNFFKKYSYLNKKKLLYRVNLGLPTVVIPGSALWKKSEELGITYPNFSFGKKNIYWEHEETGNNFEVRIKRWFKLRSFLLKLNYRIDDFFINKLKKEFELFKIYSKPF